MVRNVKQNLIDLLYKLLEKYSEYGIINILYVLQFYLYPEVLFV